MLRKIYFNLLKKVKKMKSKISERKIPIILSITVIITIIAPTLLTRPAYCELFDFTKTGGIGDTIGGITAPILRFVSIFLLYETFREQRKFNRSQIKYKDYDLLVMITDHIKAKSGRISLEWGEPHGKIHKGLFAISREIKHYDNGDIIDEHKLDEVLRDSEEVALSILDAYRIIKASSLDETIKELFRRTITKYAKVVIELNLACSDLSTRYGAHVKDMKYFEHEDDSENSDKNKQRVYSIYINSPIIEELKKNFPS
ncbi:hypothetical protein HQ35_07765 [Porphyromonas cangingivalis]|uniref:Uncharacterized protein n=2 Tax=Porphyromonas cangingivalis TaxID=36874 RepID=A0A0A2EPN3_PORCN|nr:hypothetical protein HQ35_07765 [Porphyromonas cangingivalis]